MSHSIVSSQSAAASEFVSHRNADSPLYLGTVSANEYARDHQLRAIRLPGGTCFAHKYLPSWDFNRVLKFGVSYPTTERWLKDIQSWMHMNAGPNYNIGVDPNTQPECVPDWLRAAGLTISGGGMTRFIYDGGSRENTIESTFNVREIEPHEGDLLGTLLRTAFDLPEGFDTWLGELAGRPGWRIFIACDGAVPVATGAMYVNNGLAWLGLGATLKDHRRQGAQSLLLSTRVSEAKKMGVTGIHIEGTVRFFVCGPVTACRQAGPDSHQVGLMNRSPYRIAN